MRLYISMTQKSSNFQTSSFCLCFFSLLFFYRIQKPEKYVVWFTSTSRKSWSFLHVAEKVSEVPNSKYHSLFFVLKETRRQELQRDQAKRKHRSVFSHIKIWSLYRYSISSLCLYSSICWAYEKEKRATLQRCTSVWFMLEKGTSKLQEIHP